jgi:hypothetical protein
LAPQEKLHVGATNADVALMLSGQPSHAEGLKIWHDYSVGSVYFDSQYNHDVGSMFFRTKVSATPVDAMVITGGGKIGIGTTTPGNKLIVVANDASNWGSRFVSDGNNSNRYGIVVDAGADDAGGTNYAISIRDGDGGDQGHITFTSGTITYGAFTAHHEVSLPNADADSEYPYGTLVETVNIYYRQKDGSDTERGIRYNVKKTSSAYSKKVLGSYGGSMNNNPSGESNLHQVLILGDGHILCNSEKGNIEIGDGICTSSSEGEGMKADKTAMIIGIAQEDVSFSGEESKLVAVQFGLSQFTPW